MNSKQRRLALAGVLSLGLAAPPAAATHDPLQTLNVVPADASYVEVGIDDDGNATVAWIEGGALMVATRQPRTNFAEPQTIAPSGVVEASLDVAPAGNTVLAFRGSMAEGSLMASVRPGGDRGFPAPQALLPVDADAPSRIDAEASDNGRAVVVWQSEVALSATEITAARAGEDGRFGEPEHVASGRVTRPRVGTSSLGEVIVVWQAHETSQTIDVAARAAGEGEPFGSEFVVATLPSSSTAVDVAVNGAGDTVLAYENDVGPRMEAVEILYGDVTGEFGAPQRAARNTNSSAIHDLEVAIDESGRAAVVATELGVVPSGLYALVTNARGRVLDTQLQPLSPDQAGGAWIERDYFEIAAHGGMFTALWINDHDHDGVDDVWSATTAGGGRFGEAHELMGALDRETTATHATLTGNARGVVFGWLAPLDEVKAVVGPVPPGTDPVFGTDASETVQGTLFGEWIYAARGDDVVRAGPGDDDVAGEEGDDELHGGRGGDWLLGGDGDDVLIGGRGKDLFSGGDGHDVCVTTKGDDMDYSTGCDEYRTRKKR